MSNNLIICSTVLQAFIARKILEKEKLSKDQLELFYYTQTDNEINQTYYSFLAESVGKANYFYLNKKVFQVLSLIKDLFNNKNYDTVYLASIDSPLIYFILSMIKFNQLVTFDDGTANIVKTSIYYRPEKSMKTIFRNILYFFLGNHYSLKKIKKQITKHFTLYQGISNISHKIEFLDFANFLKQDSNTKKKSIHCIIILGTVFSNITDSEENREKLQFLLKEFIKKQSTSDIIYIPHPREKCHFDEVATDSRTILAEEKIIEILDKYEMVSLYGFCSSAQFNLMSFNNIKNYYFVSSLFDKNFHNYLELANQYLLNEESLDIIPSDCV